jgi:hypothetical protein
LRRLTYAYVDLAILRIAVVIFIVFVILIVFFPSRVSLVLVILIVRRRKRIKPVLDPFRWSPNMLLVLVEESSITCITGT